MGFIERFQNTLLQRHRFFGVTFVEIGFLQRWQSGSNVPHRGWRCWRNGLAVPPAAAAYMPEQIEFVRCRTKSDYVADAYIAASQDDLDASRSFWRQAWVGGCGAQSCIVFCEISLFIYVCTHTGIAFECHVDQLLHARVIKIVMLNLHRLN